MPTSENASIGAAINSSLNAKPINNPKSLTISPAKNGFIVQMAKTTEYGQDYAVATTIDEVAKIITDYLSI